MAFPSADTVTRDQHGTPEGVPFFVAVDWGTTSFRAYLATRDGGVLAISESDRGILSVADGNFSDVLSEAVAPWHAAHGSIPILMCGMIGSRQGWRDVPYVACPGRLADVAAGIAALQLSAAPAAIAAARVGIVPGLAIAGGGRLPDVMRGEETQVLGALRRLGLDGGTFVLPGTHAKWVTVRDHAITSFRTYMTGEVFAALKGHTILGRLMQPEGATGAGFAAGLEAARQATGGPGALLNLVFSARTRGLMSELPGGDLADYLSGLLIGAEILDAAADGGTVAIIAGEALAIRYRDACARFGIAAVVAPPDCAVAGLAAIGETAGWMAR